MMYYAILSALALLASSPVAAFTASPVDRDLKTCGYSTSLKANRREVFETAFVSVTAMASSFVTITPQVAMAEPRPMYLSEPTEEFKANEAKAMEFKRQQLARKKEFNTVLDKFLGEPNDEAAIVKDLKEMQGLIAKAGGLPLGIKKDELFKIIRSKKAKGFWPTNCEIAYQSLQGEIRFQQSPNLDKENGNPFQ